MANIQIFDGAGTGLDLPPGGDWIAIISEFAEITNTAIVTGPATINIELTFNNGEFIGLLEVEPVGNDVRLDRFSVRDAQGELVIEGNDINALATLATEIEDIQVLSDPFEGADTVIGNVFADLLSAGAGDDTLSGNGGDDTLIGESGNDSLNGGEGTDTAAYSGSQTSYTLTLSPGGMTLEDRRAEGNGTDTLTDLEFLDFDTDLLNGPFSLDTFAGLSGLSGSDLETFIELYIAYFNRAPDAIGLSFWGTAFANGVTLEESASFFIDQDETRETYPEGLSNLEFATAVYNNVLGRIPDQDGLDFWVGALNSGGVGRDQFILSVLGGAKAPPPPDATQEFIDQQQADQAYLANKTDIGAYYAVHRGLSDVDDASTAMALFDGSQQSITTAVNAIDQFHTEALDPETGAFLMPLVGILQNPFVPGLDDPIAVA